MIIVCSGPDTYRARQKARELVAAFRGKHDPEGLATEVLDDVPTPEMLLSRLGSTSLFSSKKLVRADGLLTKMKIADVRTLASRLEKDKDGTIVLTLETEPPHAKTLEALKPAPLFHYPFVILTGTAFRVWIRDESKKLDIPLSIADRVAEYAEGDSWFAVQEMKKQSAHAHDVSTERSSDATVFDVADAVLSERQGWRVMLDNLDDDNAINMLLSQARSYLRVRDGHAEGLHPYVAKKLKSLRSPHPVETFSKILQALVASRTSLSSGQETESIL